jgi:hypothetical protein
MSTDDGLSSSAVRSDASDSDYLLVTFAPSSGVGFYQFDQDLYEFDIVSGEDSLCRSVRFAPFAFEQDQLDADISFRRLDDLKAFARTEYLRDKKHSYLFSVLTHDFGRQSRRKVLAFLDDSEVADIQLGEKFRPILREACLPELVQQTLLESQENRNLFTSLARDIPEVVFDTIEHVLPRVADRPEPAEQWLSLIADVVRLVRSVPDNVAQAIVTLLRTVESSWTVRQPVPVQAISNLAEAVGYRSPKLFLRLALDATSSRQMSDLYRQAVPAGQISDAPSERLSQFRRLDRALEKRGVWSGVWDWPFPWQTPDLSDHSFVNECVQAAFSYQGVSFGGTFRSGLPFTVRFANRPSPLESSILEDRERASSILAARVAFWLAFLRDPHGALERLHGEENQRFRSSQDLLRMTSSCYELWGSVPRTPAGEPSSLWSVCYPDMLNFAVLPQILGRETSSFHSEPAELVEIIAGLGPSVGDRDIRAGLGLQDPIELLANNLLAIALFQGDVRLVRTLVDVMTRLPRREELSGVLCFVV